MSEEVAVACLQAASNQDKGIRKALYPSRFIYCPVEREGALVSDQVSDSVR